MGDVDAGIDDLFSVSLSFEESKMKTINFQGADLSYHVNKIKIRIRRGRH